MASQPRGWAWPGAPLFMRVIPAAGVCYRCGRAGGCAAQASALPRLYTEAEVAARVAEARNKALDEAAAVASKGEADTKEVSENPAYDADTRHTFYTMGRACKEIAAAIRAEGAEP